MDHLQFFAHPKESPLLSHTSLQYLCKAVRFLPNSPWAPTCSDLEHLQVSNGFELFPLEVQLWGPALESLTQALCVCGNTVSHSQPHSKLLSHLRELGISHAQEHLYAAGAPMLSAAPPWSTGHHMERLDGSCFFFLFFLAENVMVPLRSGWWVPTLIWVPVRGNLSNKQDVFMEYKWSSPIAALWAFFTCRWHG